MAAATSPQADDQPLFSNRSFKGTYAVAFHGSIVTSSSVVGALSGTGTMISDGKGHISGGTETISDGTNVCTGTLAGSYAVNADGTGTMSVAFTTNPAAPNVGSCPPSPVTRTSAFAIQSQRSIATASTDTATVISGHLDRQHNDNGDD